MAKCLLECLQEVHLEKYQTNFVRNGICTCENLSGLSINDFVKCGIVSIDDRLRLFKLIQFIKSMQAQGHNCNHAHDVNRKAHSDVAAKLPDVRKSSNHPNQPVVSNVKQVVIEDARSRSPEESQRTKHSARALSPSAVKPQTQGSSQSPVFRCRKVLTFNDSELQSSESEDDNYHPQQRVGAGGSGTLVFKHLAERDTNTVVKPKPDTQKCVAGARKSDNSASNTKFSAVRVSQPNVIATVNNKPVALTNASILPAEVRANRVNTVPVDITYNRTPAPSEHSISMPQPSATMVTKEFAIYSSPLKNATQESALPRKVANEAANLKRNEAHAYFQTKEALPLVEKVFYHNQGYNYGIPGAVSSDIVAGSEATMNHDKIRVCVRKRPLNARETKLQEIDIVDIPESGSVIVHEAKVTVDLKNYIQQHIFQFDDVFDETCSNNDVYLSAVRPLVFYVFRGGMATCFGFGQTGAGKSHTLLGNRGASGLFMLAAKDMFTFLSLDNSGRGMKLCVSFYEIYCGHVFDLLDRRRRVHIRENSKHRICVSGLSELQAGNIGELTEIVKRGLTQRSTGCTGVNQTSSRSHAVLQFEVKDSDGSTVGRLTFIDLAGSERASDAKDGDRQTRMEGAEINQSLLALKECIRSLDQESGHTPYRQSKLTHVLRDSFVGNSHTVMIANISPSLSAFENTMNTLRYANRVKELRQSMSSSGGSSRSPQETSKPKTPTTTSTTPRLTRKVTSLGSNHVNAATSSSREPVANNDSAAGPSVFHTSKIMSSTPKKRGESTTGSKEVRAMPMDVSAIIQDSPVKGHAVGRRLTKPQKTASHDVQPASVAAGKVVSLNAREAQVEPGVDYALGRGESIQSGDMAACGHATNSDDNSACYTDNDHAEVKVAQAADDDDDDDEKDASDSSDEQDSDSGEFEVPNHSAEGRAKPSEVAGYVHASNEINRSKSPKSSAIQIAAETSIGKGKPGSNNNSQDMNRKLSADKNARFEDVTTTDALDASMNTTVDGGADDEVAAQHKAMMDRLNSLLLRATLAVEREQRSVSNVRDERVSRPGDGHTKPPKAATEVAAPSDQGSDSVVQDAKLWAVPVSHSRAVAATVHVADSRLNINNSSELELPSPEKPIISPRRPDVGKQQALVFAAAAANDDKSPTVRYKKRLPTIPVPADNQQENRSPGCIDALGLTAVQKQQSTSGSEAVQLDASTGERPSWSEVLSTSTTHSSNVKDTSFSNADGAISNEPLDLRLRHNESREDKALSVDSGISSHNSLPQPQLPLVTPDLIFQAISRREAGQGQGLSDIDDSHTRKSVLDEAEHRAGGRLVHHAINSQSYTVTVDRQSQSNNSSLISDQSSDTLSMTSKSQSRQPAMPVGASMSSVKTANDTEGSHTLPSQYSASQSKQSSTQSSMISATSETRFVNNAHVANAPVPYAGSAFRAVHADKAIGHNVAHAQEVITRERIYPAAAFTAPTTEHGVTMVTTAVKAKKHSPLKIEKLATFNPIQPFPATSYRQSRVTAPTVITKTVLVSSGAGDSSDEDEATHAPHNAGHDSSQEAPPAPATVAKNSVAAHVTDGMLRHQPVARESAAGVVARRVAPSTTSRRPVHEDEEHNSEEPSEEDQAYEMTLLHNVQGLLMSEHEQSLEEMTAMSKEEMKLLLAVRNGSLEFPTYLDTLQELLSLKAECIISLLSQIGKFQDITANRIGRSHHHQS